MMNWATSILPVPLSEFSTAYGGSMEEQAQRVAINLVRLHQGLVGGAPFPAGETLKHLVLAFFKLLSATLDEQNHPWQVTEAKRLIVEEPLLRRALVLFGHKVPEGQVVPAAGLPAHGAAAYGNPALGTV